MKSDGELDPVLATEVVSASSRPGSPDHGEQHWKAVAWAGLRLAATEPCDLELVLLFALFHDSRRFNEYHDPEHGLRGGELARSMCGRAFDLEPERLELLADACTRHDKGATSSDPTVGVCWDADRLNLWRVGIVPDPRLLSTPGARRRELIEEARTFHGRQYDWPDLFQRVAATARRSTSGWHAPNDCDSPPIALRRRLSAQARLIS
jgi:uncharacterized protein